MDQKKLNQQFQHWEASFSNKPEMFGLSPSIAAVKALKKFKEENITSIIELGAGLGRDTIFFAQNSIHVEVLDYSKSSINSIIHKTEKLGLTKFIKAKVFDVRKKLPYDNNIFGGCFSHMLYCMAFTTKELNNLSNEIHRVLKPGGINIYTVRHTEDADYGIGIHRGEDLYETGGFIVHYFSTEKIKQLSTGFNILNIESFKEGSLPRKLFQVTLRKK